MRSGTELSQLLSVFQATLKPFLTVLENSVLPMG